MVSKMELLSVSCPQNIICSHGQLSFIHSPSDVRFILIRTQGLVQVEVWYYIRIPYSFHTECKDVCKNHNNFFIHQIWVNVVRGWLHVLSHVNFLRAGAHVLQDVNFLRALTRALHLTNRHSPRQWFSAYICW